MKETIYNHLDYVQSLSVYENQWVATGGRGDKAIYVYETDEKGKLWKRFKFDGHEVNEETKAAVDAVAITFCIILFRAG